MKRLGLLSAATFASSCLLSEGDNNEASATTDTSEGSAAPTTETSDSGSPDQIAQAACEMRTDFESCEATAPAEGYFCDWSELRAYVADGCGAGPITSRCLAYVDSPPPSGCLPDAACAEPAPLHGITYVRPVWSVFDEETVLLEACGVFPVGFTSCTFASGDDPICECACTGAE